MPMTRQFIAYDHGVCAELDRRGLEHLAGPDTKSALERHVRSTIADSVTALTRVHGVDALVVTHILGEVDDIRWYVS